MFKKVFLISASLLLVLAGSAYLFRTQLWEVPVDHLSKDIFIAADTDDFDPGLAVGSKFPAIKALYKGTEVNDIRNLSRDKGMVFIANRSADW